MTKQELTASDMVTLMAACAIATERFPHASEYEDMRQRILKASVVTIETPDREWEREPSAPAMMPGAWRCELHRLWTTGDCPDCDAELIAVADAAETP